MRTDLNGKLCPKAHTNPAQQYSQARIDFEEEVTLSLLLTHCEKERMIFMKKLLVCCFCGCMVLLSGSTKSFAKTSNLTHHSVLPSESYWSIANDTKINFFDLLKLNNATQSSYLNVGDTVLLPSNNIKNFDIHKVVSGDSYFKISKLYNVNFYELLDANNANQNSWLAIGDIVIIPKSSNTQAASSSTSSTSTSSSTTSQNSTNYKTHTVKSGDTLWNISIQYGIPLQEILDANNLTENSSLSVGMTLSIPVHNVAVKQTLGDGYGELLDWYSEANYVLPVNAVFKVTDFYTKTSFYMKRTTGSCHADCEPLTSSDAQIIKNIWGGNFSWSTRPILIEYNGRTLACSMSSYPHAGNDNYAGGAYVTSRSGNYGAGYNFDWVKNNSVDGVMDIHFLNSTKHSDGKIDQNHQNCIKIAAGLVK